MLATTICADDFRTKNLGDAFGVPLFDFIQLS
jgi:hypothetical protein